MKKLILFLVVCTSFLYSDEGMYPISEIHKLNLKKLGLLISQKDLYNPNGVSLIDAIVQVGGCTGSFISSEGLVITNHHCAFGAVQAISTAEKDYITDGFLAADRSAETPARGMTIRITESYKDVSKDVLSVLTPEMSLGDRSRAVSKKMRELADAAEKENPGKQAQVSEMFAGRTYVLFIYQRIRDVRLVYVPPRSIGEFGGENDNWVWPRHTGDFSFVRAYVAPDGSPAEYAETNVPYKPKKFLKVNPNGVDDGDAVFILGYPGRTFRHQPAAYIAYEESHRLPFVADWFEWQIQTMQAAGKGDRAIAIKYDSRIKGLANVMKNYRGKLTGLNRLALVNAKREEEKRLQEFIDKDARRKEAYGNVLTDIEALYRTMGEQAERELILSQIIPSSLPLSIASNAWNIAAERAKPDSLRRPGFSEAMVRTTIANLKRSFRDYHRPTDERIFAEILRKAQMLPEDMKLSALASIVGPSIDSFVSSAYAKTMFGAETNVDTLFSMSTMQLEALNDPMVSLVKALEPDLTALRNTREERDGALTKLLALYVDVKEQYTGKDFIPDANSTLRMTFGRIKGYSPSDATYYSPITTLQGVLEKTTGEEPYNSPSALMKAAAEKRSGPFVSKKLKDIPVGLLYNTDTTGGNSGSPLMNAKGELVGVNFDRAYHATINDFAWSDSYSRSIAVDIRYVLWVTKEVGGAGFLLKEMGVE